MVVRSGDLHCDWTEGSWGVTGTEDIFLPEAVPFGRRQDAHRRDAGLLQGVVTQRGDGESACRSCWFPGRVKTDFFLAKTFQLIYFPPMSFMSCDPASQTSAQINNLHDVDVLIIISMKML